MINKVFYTPLSVDSDNFITGDYYSYILNKDNQNIIIIRRGLLNSISELTYVIYVGPALDTYKDFHSQAVLMYDTYLKKFGVSLVTKDNSLVNVNNFIFKDEQLMCKFKEQGEYKINFYAQSETCENANNDSSNNKDLLYCLIYINSVLLVVELVTPYLLTLRIILGILMSIIGISLIVVILTCTRCFKKKIKDILDAEIKYVDSMGNKEINNIHGLNKIKINEYNDIQIKKNLNSPDRKDRSNDEFGDFSLNNLGDSPNKNRREESNDIVSLRSGLQNIEALDLESMRNGMGSSTEINKKV